MRHIAGTSVILNEDHVIQRCMICGFALIDQKYSETAVEVGFSGNAIPDFDYGSVVEVSGPQNSQKMCKIGQMVDPNYEFTEVEEEALDGFNIYHSVNDIKFLCRRD